MKTKNTPSHTFAGLTDWFEVFRAGMQTDSSGHSKEWTTEELDQIVANFDSSESAPLVVGHPKTDDPAWGWTGGLKREGDVLLAKARSVVPEFESAVKSQMYPKRSIALTQTSDGFALRHIGFLGAAPPAVKGLEDILHSDSEVLQTFEFSMQDAVERTAWNIRSIGGVLRRFKNWFIEENGAEAAEQVIPEYALEDLAVVPDTRFSNNEADKSSGRPGVTVMPESDSVGTKEPNTNASEENGMSEFTQAELDEAVAEALAPVHKENERLKKEAEDQRFAAHSQEAKDLVESLVEEGKLLPAQTEGVAEFLAALSADAETSFEFTSGEGKDATQKSQKMLEFMKGFLGRLGKQIELRKESDAGEEIEGKAAPEFSAPGGLTVDQDSAELDRKALEYSKKHGVDYVTAVQVVSQEEA